MSSSSHDRPEELPAKVAAALDRLARARRLHRQGLATRHGLTPLQIDLLAVLADGPPPEPTVGLLAAEVGVAQPTATDSLRALSDKGLRNGTVTVARTCLTCQFHRDVRDTHRCALLGVELAAADLRVNCPDHRAA